MGGTSSHPALSEGLRPSDSPTRALARRFVGALRSRGSLALANEHRVYEIPLDLSQFDACLVQLPEPCPAIPLKIQFESTTEKVASCVLATRLRSSWRTIGIVVCPMTMRSG